MATSLDNLANASIQKNATINNLVVTNAALSKAIEDIVIGHGIGGKYIPIMARLAKARCWSKQ